MAVKFIDDSELEKIAGGAISLNYESNDKYLFICTRCGNHWTGNDENPKHVHGCKKCGWWFQTLKDDGNWKRECVAYIPIADLRSMKKNGNTSNFNFSLNFKLF